MTASMLEQSSNAAPTGYATKLNAQLPKRDLVKRGEGTAGEQRAMARHIRRLLGKVYVSRSHSKASRGHAATRLGLWAAIQGLMQ